MRRPVSPHVTTHKNFKIMSTLNRFRTNRTRFQTRTFVPSYCRHCPRDRNGHPSAQCLSCQDKKSGHTRYTWGTCPCQNPNPPNSVHHIIHECRFTYPPRQALIRWFHKVPRSVVRLPRNLSLPLKILGNPDLTTVRQRQLNERLYALIRVYTRSLPRDP